MAIDGQKNVDGLRRRLAELPNIRNLITDEDRVLTSLANAWHLGATEWSDVHPFIELIFGKVHEGRLAKLEQALPLLTLGPLQLQYFREHLANDQRQAYSSVDAAITEMMVAVDLALVGAAVRFVEAGPFVSVRRTPSLTPPAPGATWLVDGRRASRGSPA
jgi:hypothetical protein